MSTFEEAINDAIAHVACDAKAYEDARAKREAAEAAVTEALASEQFWGDALTLRRRNLIELIEGRVEVWAK